MSLSLFVAVNRSDVVMSSDMSRIAHGHRWSVRLEQVWIRWMPRSSQQSQSHRRTDAMMNRIVLIVKTVVCRWPACITMSSVIADNWYHEPLPFPDMLHICPAPQCTSSIPIRPPWASGNVDMRCRPVRLFSLSHCTWIIKGDAALLPTYMTLYDWLIGINSNQPTWKLWRLTISRRSTNSILYRVKI